MLVAMLAAVLLSGGLAACGGGDDSPTANEATPGGQAGGEAPGGGDSANGGGGRSGSGNGEQGRSGEGQAGDANGGESGDFAPREHDDSGGGAEQFRVKGGDNSIQEFGSEAEDAEFDEAAAAVHGFLDARLAGDWEAACGYLASDVTESLKQFTGNSKELKGKGCPGILEALSAGAPRSALKAAAQADIGSLRVEGDRAFVIYHGAQDTAFAMPMKEEDGSWKVASLAGTPIN